MKLNQRGILDPSPFDFGENRNAMEMIKKGTVTMNEQKSRSRHLVDQEIIRAIDLIPTSDLTDTALMESRENQAKMLPQVDITQLFPVTFEERSVPSYFGGPDIRIEIIKPREPKYNKMPLYYAMHGGGMVRSVTVKGMRHWLRNMVFAAYLWTIA